MEGRASKGDGFPAGMSRLSRGARWLQHMERASVVFARLALAAAFLSAVADRFGMWGPPGAAGVAWGDFPSFLDYTARLNPYLPAVLIPVLGWGVTIAEVAAALLLLTGVWLTRGAVLAAVLLLGFSVGMTIGTGVKSALDASVPSAAAAALLLAARKRREEEKQDNSARTWL